MPLKLRIKTVFLCAFMPLVLALPGCVTESSNRRVVPVSQEQALQDHIQLGLSYLGQGNRQSARFHLLKALDLDDRSAGAHNGMALLFQMELENALAEEHFEKAISYDSDFTRARNNYGVFLFQQERYEEALKQFEKASQDTNYELRPQVFLSLGIVAERLGRHQQAEESWNKALALEPRLAGVYLEFASLYFKQQDFSKARQYLATYDRLGRPTARSLWLAVRIEHHFGNWDAQASKGLALKKLFPRSQENREYQQWLKNERGS
jgi:type IV pilus assembly protein PilF